MTNSAHPDSISHSGQGDIVLGNKIERQINQAAGGTYIENQTIHNGAPEAPPPPKKDGILFLSASPAENQRLNVEREFQVIREELQRGSARDRFDLQQEMGVRIADWVRAMSRRPRIVHFAGHGNLQGIQLIDDASGMGHLVEAPVLARIFRNTDEAIELVLLNACYGAAQAEMISRQGIFFIGFNGKLPDRAGIEFARGLYIGIGEGKSFMDSLNDAMIFLLTHYPRCVGMVEVWKDGVKLEL
jgi:CHAT domain-containing protein